MISFTVCRRKNVLAKSYSNQLLGRSEKNNTTKKGRRRRLGDRKFFPREKSKKNMTRICNGNRDSGAEVSFAQ